MIRKTTLTAALAGLATAVALAAGSAYAATAAPDAASGAHAHAWGHFKHGEHGGFEKQLEKLHAELKLNPQQEALWKTAVDTMHANREQMRAQHKANKEQMKAAMQQPILDLAAMHAAREQQAQQARQMHEQTTQAWLNVYSALDDQQKTMVSTALKTRWQKFAQHRAAMRGHWEHHQAASTPAAQ
jgi:Spy/CpxP family protein refolding chaperone